MPQVLPFENIPEQAPNDDHSRGAVVQCPLHNILPAPLLERAEESPHLMSYLHKVPMTDFGVPEYWVADPEERVVWVWRFAAGARDAERVAGPLTWRPSADVEPLEIDLASLFRPF